MHEKEHFKPETVDERIEQLTSTINALNGELHTTDSADERLVETLQHIYHQEISQEDRYSLERARLRIISIRTGSVQSHNAPGEDSEAVKQQRLYGKRSISMQIPSQTSGSSKKRALYHWVNILAAVLVIGLVVGSLLVITNIARHTPGGSQTASPSKAHTPVPPSGVTDGQQNVYSANPHNVYKLSGKDGSVIWKRAINDTVQHNYGLRVVNGIVFLSLDYNSMISYALKASDGTILWKMPQHPGQLVTTNIVGNSVFMLRQSDGVLFAYDAQSGVEKWHYTPVAKGVSYIVNNDTIYLKIVNASLYALNVTTGTERWHYTEAAHRNGTEFTFPTIVVDGVVYDASTNYLYALQASDGRLLWQQQASSTGQAFGSFRIQGDLLFTDTDELSDPTQHTYAFNIKTGQQQWKLDKFMSLGLLSGVPVNLPNGIFLAQRSDHTLVYVINSKDGSVIQKIANSCLPAPSDCTRFPIQVIGEKLYVLYTLNSSKSSLETYDLRSGVRTSKPLSIAGTVFPTNVQGGIAYITPLNNGETITAVRLSDGEVLWKHTLDHGADTVRVEVAP